ncbi:unnamed protein product [Rotaria sp. Silwood1]|nr:unnamed protein product [Rotaria sp. Silwood1]
MLDKEIVPAIEDAYKEQRPQVKIDDGYVLDFKQQIQYEKDDQHRQHPIKRVQLERDRNNVHIREERFSSSVTLTSTSTAESRTISDQLTIWQKNNLASADYECKLENKNNTLADIVEEVAEEMIKEGTAVGKTHEAQ